MQKNKKGLMFALGLLLGGVIALSIINVFKKSSYICSEDQCFLIEIADTPKTREIGLMNRTSLADDAGMLFVFDQSAVYSFWMKNTLIPLDMLRLDENFKILYIEHSAQPCTANPCPGYGLGVSARYVLELKGGISKEVGIEIGESMTMKK